MVVDVVGADDDHETVGLSNAGSDSLVEKCSRNDTESEQAVSSVGIRVLTSEKVEVIVNEEGVTRNEEGDIVYTVASESSGDVTVIQSTQVVTNDAQADTDGDAVVNEKITEPSNARTPGSEDVDVVVVEDGAASKDEARYDVPLDSTVEITTNDFEIIQFSGDFPLDLYDQMAEAKARNAQSIPRKKLRENGGNEQDGGGDGFSMLSSSAMLTKEREELAELEEKVEELQRQLMEKDEILKSAEASKNEASSVHSILDQLKKQALEKDALLRSTQAQLGDVKWCGKVFGICEYNVFVCLVDTWVLLDFIRWASIGTGFS